MRNLILTLLLATVPTIAFADWPVLTGPNLGQEPPGMTPKVFAPGLVSLDGERELNAVYSPDGRIFMFSRQVDGVYKMYFSFLRGDETWQEPRLAGPSKTFPGHHDVGMAFSQDGDWLYFISDRPLPGYSLDRYNVWRSRITRHGLTTPEPLSDTINGPGHELYPMLVEDGSLYFSAGRSDALGEFDIYRAQFEDGRFNTPVNVGPQINSASFEGDVYVSPDETYMIHVSSGRADGLGESDLYISFRNPDGSWRPSVHMGSEINSEDIDYCPMVSPDGKHFYYTQGEDLMWVDAGIIETFR